MAFVSFSRLLSKNGPEHEAVGWHSYRLAFSRNHNLLKTRQRKRDRAAHFNRLWCFGLTICRFQMHLTQRFAVSGSDQLSEQLCFTASLNIFDMQG